jgi:regulator of sigma D
MNPERIPSGWNKIRSPAGDCVTLTSYREYVCRMLREELTLDECRELLDYLHCGIDELVDKIVERNMVGKTTAKRKG